MSRMLLTYCVFLAALYVLGTPRREGERAMERKAVWLERLLAGTRGHILRLLRRRERTVTELAAELSLTDNAVRTHLSALERDGLVEALPAQPRGVGKPPVVYRA